VKSQRIEHCLITKEPVVKVLDFGQHPYADTFVAEHQLNLSEPVFPLQVYLNPTTGSLQLGYVSDGESRYNLYSYSYTSSNSKTARDHWDQYADSVKKKYNPSGMIVEIGSNDAYLISQFQGADNTLIGIDSSKDMCQLAVDKGITAVQNLFNHEIGLGVANQWGTASVVMANNVFNHANDPMDFARGVASLLSEDGVFIFEVPYWRSMIESNRFTDMVYHEHISYFTIKSLWNLLRYAGLELVDFDIVNYHGGSIRGYARLSKDVNVQVAGKIKQAIVEEEDLGLFDVESYKNLQDKFEKLKIEWLSKFYKLLNEDPQAVVIGVGAAAKANTWLRWHGLDNTVIKHITDASPHKQGKYTPLSRIPICGDEVFANYDRPYALILSWNIGEPLKKAILNINPHTKFISQ
jgi:SAM-dependent methyltransferase